MKTLVYGMGKIFEENEDIICRHYNVVGYCDKDLKKIKKYPGGVDRKFLCAHIDDYDEILVCAAPMSIVPELIGELKIPAEKIKVFKAQVEENTSGMMSFHGDRNDDAALLLAAALMGLNFSSLHYLEIGTNSPVNCNNSYTLYQCGARGVLVDAIDYFKPLIEAFRPEDTFIQAAVVDGQSGPINFYLPSRADGSLNLGIGSLDRDWTEKFPDTVAVGILEVAGLNINDLLARIDYEPDIILIDVEGWDIKLLKAIDYEKYSPAIIMAEMGRIDDETRSFMEKRGYSVFTTVSHCNTIFVFKKKWEAMYA